MYTKQLHLFGHGETDEVGISPTQSVAKVTGPERKNPDKRSYCHRRGKAGHSATKSQ